jgi:hypothetical protein
MHRLQERSAKNFLSHDAMSWMGLVYQLDFRTRAFPASSYSLIVMVQSFHHWKSDDLLACLMRGKG